MVCFSGGVGDDVAVMEAVELAIPVDVAAPKLMGSDVFVGARVCSSTDGEARDSETISPFLGSKIDECTSLLGHRGEFFLISELFFICIFIDLLRIPVQY